MSFEAIEVIFTSEGRKRVGESLGSALAGQPCLRIKSFKIGEGGFVNTPAGRIPNDPFSREGETDIEADGTPGSSFFQKDFTSDDFETNPDGSVRFTAILDYGEGNDNGFGDNPRYFEVGLFDQSDVMIAYGTFTEENKNPSKKLTKFIDLYFNSTQFCSN